MYALHFQMFLKTGTKQKQFARSVFQALFPPNQAGPAHPAEYDFRVIENIKWEERGQVWDDVRGEYHFNGTTLEVIYTRADESVYAWKLKSSVLECAPIIQGSSEYRAYGKKDRAIKLVRELVTNWLVSTDPGLRLRYLLSGPDPELAQSIIHQAISEKGASAGIALAEELLLKMPEYSEAILKTLAYQFQLKDPALALGFHYRALKIGVAARGSTALKDYSRSILRANLSLNNLEAATEWADECFRTPSLSNFYKSELCIDLYSYWLNHRKEDPAQKQQLYNWASRCVREFNDTRLEKALAALEK
jgi:hypothetical protein